MGKSAVLKEDFVKEHGLSLFEAAMRQTKKQITCNNENSLIFTTIVYDWDSSNYFEFKFEVTQDDLKYKYSEAVLDYTFVLPVKVKNIKNWEPHLVEIYKV